MFILSACSGGGRKDTVHISEYSEQQVRDDSQTTAERELLMGLQLQIEQLVELARLENPETLALEQLFHLSQDLTQPEQIQGLAALTYAELLFEFGRPDAFTVAEATLKRWPAHHYATHSHLFLAEQWILVENSEAAIAELTAALTAPVLEPDMLENIIQIGQQLLSNVADTSAIDWILAVSRHDIAQRESWLQQAAKQASLEYALQLRQSDHPLIAEQANFYAYLAKQRLMVGDYHAVRVIEKILSIDMPDSDAKTVVQAWVESEGEQTTVGILLPLSGKYQKYGQQALEGIRLALNRPEFEETVILHIEDTAGNTEKTIAAYNKLISHGVEWIIGPLLSDNTAALLPYLTEDIPVISLSNQVELAAQSPYLFVHSLAKTVQADFMAHYAYQHKHQRMLIIHEESNSAREEAAAFADTFITDGGEIIDVIELEEGVYDNRPNLVAMRSRTDNEELLAQLESDLHLFSPTEEMDIKLPLGFDAIYIAASGKKMSVLAGQLAYSDISRVQLYGSYRWFDGHLMDDEGRYLNGAKFATPFTSLTQPDQAIHDVQSQYRVIWAEQHDISPLFSLAYDAAMNIASLGTRLGFKGSQAIEALNNTAFSGISGNYYFDNKGISQKTFAVQVIRRGRIETVAMGK